MISGLVVFLFGLNFLKGNSLITARRNYYAIYPKLDGLKETNPININGYKVGQVSKIQLMEDGRLKVTLSFSERNLKIPEGSVVRIISADLLGSKVIQFVPGPGTREAEVGTMLKGEIQQSITEVIGEQIDPMKAKFVGLMTTLDSVLSGIQDVLNKETVKDINQSFGDISSTLKSLEHATSQLDELITSEKKNLGVTFDNITTVSNSLSRSSKSMENIIENFDTISASVRRANIEQTLADARKAIVSTNEIIAGINEGKGSIGMLVKSDSLHNQMVGTTKELQLLFEDIKAHPKRYVGFSIFGRKEKGVVLSKEEERKLKQMLNTPSK